MKEMTLREVCESANVSRRAVQGYEKAGLVSASGKNTYGYLLYDTDSQERIKRIKLYQDLRLKIKELKEIIDAPNPVLNKILEERIVKMEEEKERIDDLVDKVKQLIATLS